MRIAIVGAGFAGLATAKVLLQSGFDVTVFEKAPDVGGVWSRTRRYPGLTTQNNKGTYHLSDLPMPRDYPEWPSGQQVQAYLETYADKFELMRHVHLETEVVSADLVDGESAWEVTSRRVGGEAEKARFDHLVVANGIYSTPLIPPFRGLDSFTAAGGRVMAANELHDPEDARGKHVLIVGYGKSSCDVSIPVSDVAASTDLVARELLWKMPKKVGNVLNYKYLMLTRLGEALFRYISPKGFERFLHGPGNPVRKNMLGSVQSVATKQLKLRELQLVPHGTFEDIARSTVSLATDGFYERVENGTITVHRDQVVDELSVDADGRTVARLSGGATLPADLVVCGTGFHQQVPFLDPKLHARLEDDKGNFRLYRQILPLDVPRLTFAGYNSSFFSPLSAEMAAVWIAAHLRGGLSLPPKAEMAEHVSTRLEWMTERTQGQHARGTNIIPFSMHNIDEVLDELGLNLPAATRAGQWLMPVDPRAYRKVTPTMIERTKGTAERALSVAAPR